MGDESYGINAPIRSPGNEIIVSPLDAGNEQNAAHSILSGKTLRVIIQKVANYDIISAQLVNFRPSPDYRAQLGVAPLLSPRFNSPSGARVSLSAVYFPGEVNRFMNEKRKLTQPIARKLTCEATRYKKHNQLQVAASLPNEFRPTCHLPSGENTCTRL